jgi:hypothetical protein
VTHTLNAKNFGSRLHAVQYIGGLRYMFCNGHMTMEKTVSELLTVLAQIAISRKESWVRLVTGLAEILVSDDHGKSRIGVDVLKDGETFEWFMMQYCLIYLSHEI